MLKFAYYEYIKKRGVWWRDCLYVNLFRLCNILWYVSDYDVMNNKYNKLRDLKMKALRVAQLISLQFCVNHNLYVCVLTWFLFMTVYSIKIAHNICCFI